MKIFGFLNGLGREYDPITTVIQSSLTKFLAPTFNDVVSEVEGFDVKLKFYEESIAVNPHMAFASQNEEYRQTNPSYNPNYRGIGRSGSYRGRGGYSSIGRGFSQHQSNNNNQGERPTCQICGELGTQPSSAITASITTTKPLKRSTLFVCLTTKTGTLILEPRCTSLLQHQAFKMFIHKKVTML